MSAPGPRRVHRRGGTTGARAGPACAGPGPWVWSYEMVSLCEMVYLALYSGLTLSVPQRISLVSAWILVGGPWRRTPPPLRVWAPETVQVTLWTGQLMLYVKPASSTTSTEAEVPATEPVDLNVTIVGLPPPVVTSHETPNWVVHVVLPSLAEKWSSPEALLPSAAMAPVKVLSAHLIATPAMANCESVELALTALATGVMVPVAGEAATARATISSPVTSRKPPDIRFITSSQLCIRQSRDTCRSDRARIAQVRTESVDTPGATRAESAKGTSLRPVRASMVRGVG